MSKADLEKPYFEDHRGWIKRHGKYNELFTRKGVMRSGDYHPNTQYDVILEGEVEIMMRQGDEDVVVRKGPNQFIAIPPNMPHLFKFLTDTLMLEWWDGEFECKYYKPYRDLIDEQAKQYKK